MQHKKLLHVTLRYVFPKKEIVWGLATSNIIKEEKKPSNIPASLIYFESDEGISAIYTDALWTPENNYEPKTYINVESFDSASHLLTGCLTYETYQKQAKTAVKLALKNYLRTISNQLKGAARGIR